MAKEPNNKQSDLVQGANQTQDAHKPIVPKYPGNVIAQMQLRSPDRSPKDVQALRSSIMAAESVYYPNQQRLFDLYHDILDDAHLRGIIRKHFASIINKGLYFRKNDEHQPEFDDLIKSQNFRDMCAEILWTIMWGITGFEFLPGEKFDFLPIPRKHIKLKTQKIVWEQSVLEEGIDYTELSNVWVLGKSGDLGLLASAAYYALYKRGDLADWANYIELFGMPIAVMKYDAYDEQTKAALTKILNDTGNQLRLMVPKQADYEIKENNGSNGSGDLQNNLLDAMNKEIDVLILGGTESTSSSKSSGYGQAKVHSDQHKEIVRFDSDYLLAALNSDQFMQILKSYGFDVENGAFDFTKELDMEYLAIRAEKIDIPLLEAGVEYSEKFLRDTYGIPEPEGTDDIFSIKQAETDPQNPNNPQDPESGKGNDPVKPLQPDKPLERPKNMGYYFKLLQDFFA